MERAAHHVDEQDHLPTELSTCSIQPDEDHDGLPAMRDRSGDNLKYKSELLETLTNADADASTLDEFVVWGTAARGL